MVLIFRESFLARMGSGIGGWSYEGRRILEKLLSVQKRNHQNSKERCIEVEKIKK